MTKTLQFKITFLWLLFSVYAWGADITIIKNPVPKYSGLSQAKTLALEKTIEEVGDKDKRFDIFAGIQSVAVDKTGNVYILDHKHAAVIILDPSLKFIGSAGKQGEGPGEFLKMERTFNQVCIGLDGNLYVVAFMARRIKEFSLDGKYKKDLGFEQFDPFTALIDEKGNLFLPSLKGHILDVYDNSMKYRRSLLPGSDLKKFLFFDQPACVVLKRTIPNLFNLSYDWLSTKDIVLINQYDLSISIINPSTGQVIKKFYAWDDFILSEFKIKLKKRFDRIKETGNCGYISAFVTFFVDNQDHIYLEFLDSQNNIFLYKFSREGELVQVYTVKEALLDGIPYFFQFKDGKFYGYVSYALLIYGETKTIE